MQSAKILDKRRVRALDNEDTWEKERQDNRNWEEQKFWYRPDVRAHLEKHLYMLRSVEDESDEKSRQTDSPIPVMLKRVPATSDELRIASYLGSALAGTRFRDNRCVPIYEVMTAPSESGSDKIMVMPQLRPFNSPDFDTVGEALDCFRQIIEGVLFLHERFVAHRNLTRRSIMMDALALYDKDFHPTFIDKTLNLKEDLHPVRTRTGRSPRYFIIDFSRARAYDPRKGLPLEPVGDPERDLGLPEATSTSLETYNPFPADVYRLGILIRTQVYSSQQRQKFKFLQDLLDEMTYPYAWARPTMKQVQVEFDRLTKSTSKFYLQSPINAFSMRGYLSHWKEVLFTAFHRTAAISDISTTLNTGVKEELDVFYGRPIPRSQKDVSLEVARWKELIGDKNLIPEDYEFEKENMRFWH
ncbi:hypothetical protein V5O48_006848 [Marasmius crinis-equi]|uniref:Protein kinase domain-containing protein n=1 Tax=Marasmius crinis-equi TaxID=585013 RepID=A0ABR3FIT8_9AGAR